MVRGIFSGIERPPLWGTVLLSVVTAAFAVLLVVATTRESPEEAALPPQAPLPEPTIATVPVAVFIGDSYTYGDDGDDAGGYVAETAQAMGWQAVNLGQSSTGYTNPGYTAGTDVFAGRVDDVAAADPDVVVVQGSTNDGSAGQGSVEAAAADLYSALRAAVPDAQIIVVGPTAAPAATEEQVKQVRTELISATAAAGLPFIDPVAEAWLTDDQYRDGLHPTVEAYGIYSERLAADLRSAVSLG